MYVNNTALWKVPGGKWRYLLFDTDSTDAYYANVASMDSFVEGNWDEHNPLNGDPIFSNLAKNSEFRKQFRDRMTYLLANDFSYERIEPLIDKLEAVYTNPMVMSVRRYDDPQFTADRYKGNVSVVRDFFRERGGYIYEYMMQHMGD